MIISTPCSRKEPRRGCSWTLPAVNKNTYVTFLVNVQALQKACNAEPVYMVPVHKIPPFVQSVSLGNFMYT